MNLTEVKNALYRAGPLYAQNIAWSYSSFNHQIQTDSGLKIPNPTEIDKVIIGLINSIKEGDEAVMSAGIEIELLVDEENPKNYIGASFKYETYLDVLLDELDRDDSNSHDNSLEEECGD
jgi:hypothetical protein